MKSAYRIRMDFNEALADARRLDETAERMNSLAERDFQESINNLSYAWTGNNANIFREKEESVRREILENVKNLRNVADDIRTIARRIYEAEMRALEIARERSSR